MFWYYSLILLFSFIIGWQLSSVFGRDKAVRIHGIGVLLLVNIIVILHITNLLPFYWMFMDYFVAIIIPVSVAFVATMINDASVSS